MCTVSYIPQSNGFILTSNRDEMAFRETVAPQKFQHNDDILCYPKDTLAGGSWIAMSNKNRVVCLLNGAFIAHTKQAFHTHSRGKILIEAAKTKSNPNQLFDLETLSRTESFTLLTIDFNDNETIAFSELIWDGKHKHYQQLNPNKPYIWSSVTLYSETNRKERQIWFNQLLKENNLDPSASNLMQFHAGKHTNDNAINVIMEREGGLKTVSITQIIMEDCNLEMNYTDLTNHTHHSVQL